MAEKRLNCGINKTVIMATKINVPDINNKDSELYKILVEHKLLLKSVKYYE